MAAPADPRPLLLVVEDDDVLREGLVAVLVTQEYRICTAVDGLDALDVASRERPDLILIDVHMPRLDGAGFCRAYRRDGGAAPVVLISGASHDEITATMEACGAAAYIRKPFRIAQLLATVAGLVDG